MFFLQRTSIIVVIMIGLTSYQGIVARVLAEGDLVVDVYDRERAFNGTTIFRIGSRPEGESIIEVDMQGRVVWNYPIPLELYRGNTHRSNHLMDIELLANDNVMFVIGRTALYQINRRGTVVWSLIDPEVSHDADRLPNGNTIYVRGYVDKGEDHIREVSPDGKTVWSWNGVAQFDQPPFEDIYRHGWAHANATQRLKGGNTLISLRNFETVIEVDRQGKIVWKHDFRGSNRGGFERVFREEATPGGFPHDPEISPSGNMIVGVQRPYLVYEIDRTGTIVWQWRHPDGTAAVAHIRDTNRLPNGNTLVVEVNKLIEVAPNGDIVWQLRVPRIDHDSRFNPAKSLYKAQRIAPNRDVFGN